MISVKPASSLPTRSQPDIHTTGFEALEKIKRIAELLLSKIRLGIHSAARSLFHRSICKVNISPALLEHRNRSPNHIAESLSKKMLYAQEAMLKEPDHLTFKAVSGSNSLKINCEEKTVGPYEFGVSHCRGKRPTMEDSHLACEASIRIGGSTHCAQFFGIMDGHGGKNAADWVKAKCVKQFQQCVQKLETENPSWTEEEVIWNALKMTFVALSESYKGFDGTTASIVMILKNRLWSANAGDTRALISNGEKTIPLTEDMKPAQLNMPQNLLITQKSPGPSKYHSHYTQRILNRHGSVMWYGAPRINGNLAVGGSIGDHGIDGISARPAITCVDLKALPPNSYLCIGCDGVFDVASTRQISETLKKFSPRGCPAAAKAIVASAYQAGSDDNISAMVVNLSPQPSEEKAKTSRFASLMPFAGVGLGTITGLTERFLSSPISAAIGEKSKEACKTGFSNLPLLPAINRLKQWEIKNMALAAPLVPVAYRIARDTIQGPSQKGIYERIKTAVKNNVSLEQVVYLTAITALALTGSWYSRALGIATKAFDPSGHMMLKIATAAILSNQISSTPGIEKSKPKQILCGLYAATDAILIHNTVRSCHTIAETAAGIAWGIGIASAAKFLSKRFFSRALPLSSPEVCGSSTG